MKLERKCLIIIYIYIYIYIYIKQYLKKSRKIKIRKISEDGIAESDKKLLQIKQDMERLKRNEMII